MRSDSYPRGSSLVSPSCGRPWTPLAVELDGDRIIITSFDTEGLLLTAYRAGRELRSEYDLPTA